MEIKVAIKDIEKILQNKEIITGRMMVDEDELSDYCEKHSLDFYGILNLLNTFGYDSY